MDAVNFDCGFISLKITLVNYYKMVKKIAYFGVMYDFSPVVLFPEISTFIFVDTQPRCYFDDNEQYNRFDHKWECKHFLKNLLQTSKKYLFDFVHMRVLYTYDSSRPNINPTLLTFSNGIQTIKYYSSTNFCKDPCDELKEDLKDCNHLLLRGYFPHESLRNFLPPNICYFGFNNTVYSLDDDTKNTIIGYLHKIKKQPIIFVSDEGIRKICENIQELENYRITQRNANQN
jgi:hypothetical protein